jgi:hypothetical protein
MPITDVLIVSAVVVAFLTFGSVLAWAEHRTRHWHPSAQSAPENQPNNLDRMQTTLSSSRGREVSPA